MQEAIHQYLEEIKSQFDSGQARENAYRPALKQLMEHFDDVIAVNDPRHSEHGAPDYVFLKRSHNTIIKGYAEAKDIDKSLDKVEKTDQMERYAGYTNLFLTNYLEFRFYNNGEKYETITLGELRNGKLYLTPENSERLLRELQNFLELPPESIRSGKRLAQIMGAKARRIRDNVEIYLSGDQHDARDLVKIYDMMKKLLVHDLDVGKFADMYAQTLVYGLFVARYGDTTPDSFSRFEARDLVPRSNPFLRKFFDHIAGEGFDSRLAKIVDELCEIFSVSDVQTIVHKHLRVIEQSRDTKDPIIHFYEDFLHAYDGEMRKAMGAYYTPTPVVGYIVSRIDAILRNNFDITDGIASKSSFTKMVDTGQQHSIIKAGNTRSSKTTIVPKEFYRVQVLDPAAGTATFLNETIKYIFDHHFKDRQLGQWPDYAKKYLVPRLYGFELMMAPYTVAHLKLGMTFRETGVDLGGERLNVFLTNTLEEGVPDQGDMFAMFGLGEAVAEESRLAAEVKSEKPVMVVMGNPPYSINSNNLTSAQRKLVDKYKYVDGERIKERGAIRFEMNLNDDYIKFLAFAENLIEKNGEGILAYINNNNYLDAPTFRGVRNHFLRTFDKIYILNLHGSTKRPKYYGDNKIDENVFSGVEQGVCINIFVADGSKQGEFAEVYTDELIGSRHDKFERLRLDHDDWTKIVPQAPLYEFVKRDNKVMTEYLQGVKLDDLFPLFSSGIISANDKVNFQFSRYEAERRVEDFRTLPEDELRHKYALRKDTKSWSLDRAVKDVKSTLSRGEGYRQVAYRPFDLRWTYYTGQPMGTMNSPRYPVASEMRSDSDIALCVCRQYKTGETYQHAFISGRVAESGYISNRTSETSSLFPLYRYNTDGSRSANFADAQLSALTRNLTIHYQSEDILDYIYATLYCPTYRKTYAELLKTDFPRIPVAMNDDMFVKLRELGGLLRQAHLGVEPRRDTANVSFPVIGSGEVTNIVRDGDRVYINETQYFGNVPESAWQFMIGSYKPAQKWLKDRMQRNLEIDDVVHYQSMIDSLLTTIGVMADIDAVWTNN